MDKEEFDKANELLEPSSNAEINKKSIVIYYSGADENYGVGYIDKGNTEIVAEYISDLTGATLFKVEPQHPYAKDYQTCIEEAKDRQARHDAPIKGSVPDLADYEVIYIGSPIYWGQMPEELVTALNGADFTSKTIRPFTTHEGSGLAGVPAQIKSICQGAEVLDGLAIQGSAAKNVKDKVEAWL